jgi:hypothetical protein
VPNKTPVPLATETASAMAATRNHSLVMVVRIDDPEITVLTTRTVGVVPGAAASVNVPPEADDVNGKLFNAAPSTPQYPL